MGIYASAYLIWGIPVLAYDEESGEPTQFWSEENEYWVELPGVLTLEHYGHYEDPDNHRAILTTENIEAFDADCWTPKALGRFELNVEDYLPAAVEEFTAAVIELDEALLNEGPTWHLAAGMG